jgi:hypothetical protein
MDTSVNFITRMASGFSAFREAFLQSSLQRPDKDKFSEWEARRLRYEIFWAFYENSAYRNIHDWANQFRTDYGLYRYIRQIFNPSQRLGDFWKTHLIGGYLDPMAGDGKTSPSALPILADEGVVNSDALRRAIAQIFEWGRFDSIKGTIGLWGSIMGDVFLYIQDDVDRQMVYPHLVHPSKIQSMTLDSRGNIRGYRLVELRRDPEQTDYVNYVTYAEEASRDGENVVYKTFKQGEPYDWGGQGAEWEVPYGFVPLVHIKHKDVGLNWGWSEIHAGISKFNEIDDLASKLDDHVRKHVDPAWLFSGVRKPNDNDGRVTKTETDPTANRPEPGRDQIPAIYASNAQAKAEPLVSNLNIESVVAQINGILEEIQRDYPETREDEKVALQSNSSRAIRVARQPAESKVHETRVNYDEGLKRALQMCISIGGMRGYDAFQGFSLDSFRNKELAFHIGQRPVFREDPLDDLEYQEKFWTIAAVAVPVVGLEFFLQQNKWDPADIKKAVAAWEANGKQMPAPPNAGPGGIQADPAATAQSNGANPGNGAGN